MFAEHNIKAVARLPMYIQPTSCPASGRAIQLRLADCHLTDILAALDRGDFAAVVLLDLSAAFDSVDYHILLERLRSSARLLPFVSIRTCSAGSVWRLFVVGYWRCSRRLTRIGPRADSVCAIHCRPCRSYPVLGLQLSY
jgi:hypothetical protein